MFRNLILQLVGGPEWIFLIILIVVILIWGPNQLPKLARALGQAKKEFKKAQEEDSEEDKEKKE